LDKRLHRAVDSLARKSRLSRSRLISDLVRDGIARVA
jgi:metal-responsive CopG/Arc/MetJ family transcriptional regulator